MSGFARRLQQGASQSPVVTGNVLARDDFNRADGSLGTADVGGVWTTHVGTLTGTPAWEIAGDMVATSGISGSDNNWLSALLAISVPAGTVFCDVYLSPDNANTGVAMLASSGGVNYLNIQLNESVSDDRVAISKRVSGSTTWLMEDDTANLVNGNGYSVAVVLSGSDLTVYVDGVQRLTYALTAQDLTDLAGGTYVGLRSWYGPTDDDGGSRWDRFLVTDSTSTPAARVPAAPWNITAVNGGDHQADISWSRAGNGGSALTGYMITSSDSGHSFIINDPDVVSFHATGLNNVAQTFTVQAVNIAGSSDAGAACAQSNSVTPAVASVPDAPTAVIVAAGNAEASVSWTAPASDGGASITSYTVTSSPGNKTATSPTTSATVEGLTNGTSYTFTVTATNSAGTGPASSPSGSVTPTAPGSVTYGPDGTEWAPNTPSATAAASVTVNSAPQLLSAIAGLTTAQANAQNYVIYLADGEYASSAKLSIPANSALTSATGNVLIRAANPGGATFTNRLSSSCSALTFAYLDLKGGFTFQTTNNDTWVARCRFPGAATMNVSSGISDTATPGGQNCGLVGCVFPDNPTSSGDRLHISPNYGGSGHTPGHAMHNFTINRCWVEGMQYPAGATTHADMLQIDGLTGTISVTNTYLGPAGNNGTSQAKADIFWSADGDFCSISMTDCLLAGAYKDGQGNSSNQGGPDTRTRCVFYDLAGSRAFLFNNPLYTAYQGSTTPNTLLQNCTFYGSINTSGGTTGLTNTNSTMLSASTKNNANPGFVSPPWQWW
jgi:hypothetical protein